MKFRNVIKRKEKILPKDFIKGVCYIPIPSNSNWGGDRKDFCFMWLSPSELSDFHIKTNDLLVSFGDVLYKNSDISPWIFKEHDLFTPILPKLIETTRFSYLPLSLSKNKTFSFQSI